MTETLTEKGKKSILLIEPFYGGSHRQLMDTLFNELGPDQCELITMSAKKWHWRARTSALTISDMIPKEHNFQILFASSVLNLAELIALRPDLSLLRKVIYFHENQLVYPVQKKQERDFQYGYNQILSCRVADIVVFNSLFNKDSFLSSVDRHLRLMPDYCPKSVSLKIKDKCQVIYFPVAIPAHYLLPRSPVFIGENEPLRILWPHRWEYDKNPEAFFQSLFILIDEQVPFFVYILGESFTDVPEIFEKAKEKLQSRIGHWGFVPNKKDYYDILRKCDVVVSTALHEFFGVSLIESISLGCYPLCPNRLSYPELLPNENLYNTDNQLTKRLRRLCHRPNLIRNQPFVFNKDDFSWANLKRTYIELLEL